MRSCKQRAQVRQPSAEALQRTLRCTLPPRRPAPLCAFQCTAMSEAAHAVLYAAPESPTEVPEAVEAPAAAADDVALLASTLADAAAVQVTPHRPAVVVLT